MAARISKVRLPTENLHFISYMYNHNKREYLMEMGFKNSIDRAVNLMNTPTDYENYISIKIKPTHGGCCCFHCWPRTWEIINEYISPCGPLKDEGDVLIDKDNEKFVLECHESGPEIIVYLTAGILLTKSIIELITTLLKAKQEDHKHLGSLKIIKRRQIKGKVEEEEIAEVTLPLTDKVTKELSKSIEDAIKR